MTKFFMAEKEEGRCIYTGLATYFKHRGEWTSEHFLIAGRKLYNRFHETEPEMTVDSAVDIIISAQSYRVVFGEKNMNPKDLRKESWKTKAGKTLKSKLPKLFKDSQF